MHFAITMSPPKVPIALGLPPFVSPLLQTKKHLFQEKLIFLQKNMPALGASNGQEESGASGEDCLHHHLPGVFAVKGWFVGLSREIKEGGANDYLFLFPPR